VTPLSTGVWRVVLKRAAHDRVVVAAAFLTTLLATTLLASGPVYAEAVALSGLQRTLANGPVRDVTVAVSDHLGAPEYPDADERVTAAVEGVFGEDGVTIHRSGVSDSFALPNLPGVPPNGLTVFGFYDDLPDHARLVAGAWPSGASAGAVEAAISEGAAQQLGLQPGDTLEVTSALDAGMKVPVAVSGVYRAEDVADPFWWGSPLELDGRETISFTTIGPLVVSEESFFALGERDAEVRWRAAPRVEEIGVADLDGLRRRLERLDAQLASGDGGSFTVQTGLGGLLEDADRSLLVSRSGVLVPSVQLAVLAGAALLFLAGLLADRRSLETAVLRSRGASRGEVGLLALAEGALLAVPAVLAAPWLAALSLRALNHVGPLAEIGLELEPQVGTAAYVLAALAGILCAVGLAVPALRSASVTASVQEQGRPKPRGFVQRAGLDLVLVALAALAYWQLRRYEGPLVESVRGRLGIDPLLVAAPALGLLAGALLALRVVPAAGAVVERAAGSARGLVAPLGTRQLARRPARYARVAVLLTLAVAIGIFASAYSSTWLRSQEDRAAYDAGADIRVVPDERTGSIPALGLAGAYAEIAGIEGALPVVRQPLEVSGETATLLALDASRAGDVVRIRPDLARNRPLAELTEPLGAERPELPSVALPDRPDGIEIAARVSLEPLEDDRTVFGFRRRTPPATLSLVLEDADGLLHRVAAGSMPADGRRRLLRVPLEEGLGDAAGPAYPLSLVAVELGLDAPIGQSRRGTLVVDDITTGPGPVEAARQWLVESTELQDAFSAPEVLAVRTGDEPGFEVDFETGAAGGGGTAVTYSARPGRAVAPQTVPALVTDGFLERTGTDVGDTIALGQDQPRLALVDSVHGFPTLPSGEGGVVVDLRTYLAAAYLGTGTVRLPDEWLLDVTPTREPAVAELLQAAPYLSSEVVGRVAVEDRLTRDPVALGISGALSLGFVAAAVFAVVGFAVSAAVSTAERTTEFAVLRSLGLSGRQLSGWLALEGGLIAAFALLAGVLLGALVAWLVLPFVSLAGEGDRPFPEVVVDVPWQTVALLAGVLAAVLLVVLAVQLLLLRRLALGSALRTGEGA
jgi:FtsX-like permease family